MDPREFWYTAVFQNRMTGEKLTMEIKAASEQEATCRALNLAHGPYWKRTLLERGGEVR
jgi:hypothetical protein